MKIHLAALAIFAFASPLLAQQSGVPFETIKTLSGNVRVDTLVKLDNPWGMAYLPDGRLLITEKPGRLRIYANGRLSEPVGGVPKVAYLDQGGLLDVEIDPDFAGNSWIYLSYAELADPQPPEAKADDDPRFGGFINLKDNQLKGGAVARARLVGDQLRDVTVIWRQVPKTIGRGHFGGRLAFGPDGKLYITSGDRMRFDPAQDLASNLGKIVRINPDGTIPSDNPFVSQSSVLPDIWTIGHRNQLGIAFEASSSRLWIHEMGPLGGDELNLVVRGRDYGWPSVSNGDNYSGSHIPDHATKEAFEKGKHAWTPVISPSGFIFYTGSLFPGWRGNAIVGGLSSKALIRVMLEGDRYVGEERIDMKRRIRDVIQAPDGALLLLVDGKDGALLRMTPAASPVR